MTRLKASRTGIEPAQRRDRTPEDYSCVVAKWRGIARPRIDRHNGVSREKGTWYGVRNGWLVCQDAGTATAITRRGLSFQPPNDARYHRRRIFACRLEELVVAR